MCGINGIYAYHYAANTVDSGEVERTRDHMAARGPDGKGTFLSDDGRVGLGHRRLAIIDLSPTGAQPMSSADGRHVVTFNGEIYNHIELRRRLEAKGHIFRSNSDTEVLIHLYVTCGDAMVHELRGMFAFALWDETAKRLLLARDPCGIKPLYYADDGWTFRFASQVKALLAGGRLATDPDPAGHVGFYLWGSVPEPFTLYRNIRSLPAGTTLVVDRTGAGEQRRYHSIAHVYRNAEGVRTAPFTRAEEMRAALLDSVGAHLVADVPVGAFLSAGIDSGSVVGLMRDQGAQDLRTVTLAFAEFEGRCEDEAPLAAEVARAYGTRHTTYRVTQAEFQADLPRIIEAMDQPSIDGVNSWFVAKAAHKLGLKVAMSGLGGDELLGGYPSFVTIPRWVRRFALPNHIPGLGRALRKLASPLGRLRGAHPKAAGIFELAGTYAGAYLLQRGLFMPWELDQVLDREMAEVGLRRLAPLRSVTDALQPRPRSGFARVAALEASLYMRNQLLRDADWASMAHSLEIRVPLVDSVLLSRLAPLAVSLRPGEGKQLLAAAPSRPLHDAVARRPKTGFTTPVSTWLRHTHASGIREQDGASASRHWARNWARIVGQGQIGRPSWGV